MLGAIAGDIIGSVFERHGTKRSDFPLFSSRSRFTDDTVLTIAVAKAIVDDIPYREVVRDFAQKYPQAGYGLHFNRWAKSSRGEPYNSWGNGSAMRVSPVGFAFNTMEEVLEEAQKSAEFTHNHPEGIKGAQSIALSIYMARTGASKSDIKEEISSRFGYDLSRTLAEIRPEYHFDVSCQGSVPESIIAFLEAGSVEDAIRKAISLGGDSDTMGCIAGGIAEAFYGPLPESITTEVWIRIPQEFRSIILSFFARFPV